ncbi:hypothetical protein, conserved [Trypanosoma brucei gambiense DAL972]|uniref:Uncharacterized protein n=1 Tax=Trypanosoma brucei gambiense (strain MHOM/CI/86/DAL972) TaxID=679716 RepID=D0A6N8_TRYB9|nr:hypothetical protein, conserved [Trypanosoma brucei gambiense DAL972]CBH17339.1 hypothetical protein, conserved [Trypanosoma brucei gambiense DAL972]|eukprot:XP_011779603.1 hypothetical protein, conserved [Trypanosoma brucei gambiense DAL972]
MLKHRDNISYPPFTLDPNGVGVTTLGPGGAGKGGQQIQSFDDVAPDGAPVAAKRKRNRDIRGIERFKQVVYSEKGLSRFHAMILRNPILMYPPEGIDDARKIVLAERRGRGREKQRESGSVPRNGDDDVLAALGEITPSGDALAGSTIHLEDGLPLSTEGHREGNGTNTAERCPTLTNGIDVQSTEEIQRSNNEALANYHHQQLDTLVGLYYEFNHLTFSKLPMKDTLQMLRRCGRSCMPHVMEFEEKQRAYRSSKLEQLRTLEAEEKRLNRVTLELQEQRLQMELQEVEEEQTIINAVESSDSF